MVMDIKQINNILYGRKKQSFLRTTSQAYFLSIPWTKYKGVSCRVWALVQQKGRIEN